MKNVKILLDSGGPLLFIAPPGYGKTRSLFELFQEKNSLWVFVSPLRALANEFFQNCANLPVARLQLDSRERGKLKEMLRGVIVTTYEQLPLEEVQLLNQRKAVFILDEFHLIYYWGDSFRFIMRELYYQLASESSKLILLTATMSGKHLALWRQEMFLNYDTAYVLNVGNQQLKNKPRKIFYYHQRDKQKWRVNLEETLKQREKLGTVLVFCRYRQEVDYWTEYCHQRGIFSLGCKGGEASKFSESLAQIKRSEVIISTSVLSHGVNLPSIREIYFTHPVENLDFWLQMVGRGGRRGETFDVHTFDCFAGRFRRLYQNLLMHLFTWKTLLRRKYNDLVS